MNSVIEIFIMLSKMMYLSSSQLKIEKKDAIKIFGNRIKDNDKYYKWRAYTMNFSNKNKMFRSLYVFMDLITYLYEKSGLLRMEDFTKFSMNKIESEANVYKALLILDKFKLIEKVVQYNVDESWCRHIYLYDTSLFFNSSNLIKNKLDCIIEKFKDDFYEWKFDDDCAEKIKSDIILSDIENSNINARILSLLDNIDTNKENIIKFKTQEKQLEKENCKIDKGDINDFINNYGECNAKEKIEYIINNIDNKENIIDFIKNNIVSINRFAPIIQEKSISNMKFDLDEFETVKDKKEKNKKKYTNKLDQIRNDKIRKAQISSLEDFIKGYTDIKKCTQDNFAGRLYNALTNIDGDYRRKSYFCGDRICEVDISCCQPTLISALYKIYSGNETKLSKGFLQGSFYDDIVDFANIIFESFNLNGDVSRKEIKCAILKCMFQIKELPDTEKTIKSLKNKTLTDLKKKNILASICRDYINKVDPKFYLFMRKIRETEIINENNNKKISLLPKILQFIEVNLITECIHDYYVLNDKANFMYTIHDCIAVEEHNGEFMKKVMQLKTRNIFGIEFNIKIEKHESYKTI